MSKRLATRPNNKALDLNRLSDTKPSSWDYSRFEQIDGYHPWQDQVPEGCILYPARNLQHGQVFWFNFTLAREMGLIDKNHPDKMTADLDKMILNTFSLQIVNEWDQANHTLIPARLMKEKPYMATRYLQLQHADKRGRTSGDGRSVWNGTFSAGNGIWDISSRGTGVTKLSPGAVEANRPLKTGTEDFGYGCGQAEISELLGSAIFSEIFARNGLGTERVLAIIDLGKGLGIGVRAARNLIRPAHLFLWLKQERQEPLRRGFDFFIQRQCANGQWSWSAKRRDRYQKALGEIARSFAKFAAQLERRYIFAWLDWDGDNVLADAGIIDYGSIRQFGLRHDQYRYDDIERLSTNLNEQRGKARATVQVFSQLVEFLETGKKLSLKKLQQHEALKIFDQEFKLELLREFLLQIGIEPSRINKTLQKRKYEVEKLYQAFIKLETIKTTAGTKKLPDGFNHPAVFNMRRLLRELPDLVLAESPQRGARYWQTPSLTSVLEVMGSSFAKRADLKLTRGLKAKIENFLNAYTNFFKKTYATPLDGSHRAQPSINQAVFRSWKQQLRMINFEGRITGNCSEYLVEELLRARKKGLSLDDFRQALELYVASQAPQGPKGVRPFSVSGPAGELFSRLVNISLEHEEDI